MNERDIFLSSLEIEDPAARQAHLEAACAGNPELLASVQSLLASHDSPSLFLQTPAVQQLVDGSVGNVANTILFGGGSTANEGADSATPAPHGPDAMTDNVEDGEDEIPLGYLQPSDKPGVLGRLGHYEILEVLGRGAFGIVLKAFDEKLQRVVAIKVLAPAMAATSPARKRFLREARSSAAVRHEHVVNIHAVEEQPIPYLVMEYIPGQTLQQRLDEKGPLDIPDVLRLGRQMAEGLAAAAAKGLIHRDIKPGNILLEAGVHERVKITDFGLARAADDASMTQSGVIAGTPMYMAPEQTLGSTLDPRADLFSLGSVLYQMVSGRAPFRAASTLAVLKRVAEDTPRPIKEIIPETPQWLCDIITKLHAKNPDDRFQTAEEVAEVLAHCEAQLKNNARLQDFSKIPRVRSASSSGRWKWAAAVAVLLSLSALTEVAGITRLFRTGAPERAADLEATPAEPLDAVPAKADGFVALFNGKDLTGWKAHPAAPGHWEVKDGILIGSDRRGVLFSERGDFSNFHLRIEARINSRGDSGIFLRTGFGIRQGKEEWQVALPGGYEVDINKTTYSRKTGSVLALQRDAPPRVLGLAADDSLTQPDEWFTLEIIAEQNRFITKVNGHTTANCSDPLRSDASGHIALQLWHPTTRVQFRKIEIKELPSEPSAAPGLPLRQFASDEWIDVIPLIDPQLDKWDMRQTGKNEWRIEQGELFVGGGDDKLNKLLLPLDSDFQPSFECELEFTRRKGSFAFNLNFPAAEGDTPLSIDSPFRRGIFLRHGEKGILSITNVSPIETGKRTTLRVEVRHLQDGDRVTVWNNETQLGTWTGDRNELASINNEGYPHNRRLSLFGIGAGNEIVFHRIRVRMLDGGTADSLRPVPVVPSSGWHGSSADILTSAEYEWTKPVNLGPNVNSAEHDTDLWISADELRLLFSSDRPGGAGSHDLWECRRSRVDEAWSAAVNLGEPVNSGSFDVDPQLSADGRTLVFVSTRNDNTVGEMDLWLATRESADAAWNKPVNLGPRINSPQIERHPVLSPDGLQLIFASNRDGRSWGPWTTSRNSVDEEWSVPVQHPGVPSPINQLLAAQNIYLFEGTLRDDTCGLAHWNSVNKTWEGEHRFPPPINDGSGNGSPYYVPSSRSLYFESNRSGGQGGADLWMSRRVKKGKVALPDSEAQRIVALPAAAQVEEVRKELMRRNPGFDGKVEYKIEDGVVTEIRVVTDKVTDIAPIRVFNALRALDLSGTELDRQGNGQLSDLAPLKDMNLSSLTYLSLACTKIGDVGLVYFRNCNNLTGLRLNLTRVTNAGMANFEGCQKLQSLDLKYTKVEDAGLAHFKGCKDLNGVDFGGLNVTDEGLSHFKDCKGLAHLWLNATRVTDVGLAHLKDCTTLTHLHLAGTQATNAALANFKDCQDLTLVILENTKITDEGLVHLKNCKKLSLLNLMNTSVTAGAIDELKKTHPQCRIEWDGGVIEPAPVHVPLTDGECGTVALVE